MVDVLLVLCRSLECLISVFLWILFFVGGVWPSLTGLMGIEILWALMLCAHCQVQET